MKKILTTILSLLLLIAANAQTDTTKKKVISKNMTQKPTNVMNSEIKTLKTGLPDLKFTALQVVATPVNDNGITKYNLAISYTLMNAGTVSVLTDGLYAEGFVTNEVSMQKTQDISFKGIYSDACGAIVSHFQGRGEMLAPGASIQKTFYCTNLFLPKDPKPVYVLLVNLNNAVKESDMTNNRATLTILL